MSTNTTTQPHPRPSRATVALWASACALAALVAFQAADRWAGPSALAADVVSHSGDYTLLTFNAGDDDVLMVLDGRGESLFAYRIKNLNQFELIEPYDLKTIFQTSKRLGAGPK